eukprot:CAMPEP_0119380018 /NCGR_PEP_ID=MMETSP1334-20130426/55108_1 /TAXON_ID=127549 /ORGANISM="Calcidiscus leptoporus, Strain RCC1130" /LENGTH=74 /DNA_ID=CAMNT_0007399691 /DNA_START=147 /DNA_END=368 /DNA_ORIENTATION=-
MNDNTQKTSDRTCSKHMMADSVPLMYRPLPLGNVTPRRACIQHCSSRQLELWPMRPTTSAGTTHVGRAPHATYP